MQEREARVEAPVQVGLGPLLLPPLRARILTFKVDENCPFPHAGKGDKKYYYCLFLNVFLIGLLCPRVHKSESVSGAGGGFNFAQEKLPKISGRR